VTDLVDDLKSMDESLSRQDIIDLMTPGMEQLLLQEELAKPGVLPTGERAQAATPNGAPAPTWPATLHPSRSQMLLRRRSTQTLPTQKLPDAFRATTRDDDAPPLESRHARRNHEWLLLAPHVRERSDSPPVRGGSVDSYVRDRSKSV
jgi:hypothetical protein